MALEVCTGPTTVRRPARTVGDSPVGLIGAEQKPQ